MNKQTKSKRENPAIKGYLPIRIALPPIKLCGGEKHSFTSFIYVKEHVQKQSSQGGGGGGATLFVGNAPANGPVRTDVFLRALFERYGEIQRVTVAKDPRKVGASSSGEEAVETFRVAALREMDDGFAPTKNRRGDGKFAHVVFTSGKEMKKALKSMKKEISKADGLYAIRLDDDRMEQLEMETAQLIASENHESDDDDESQDDAEKKTEKPLTGVHATAAEARQKAGRHISREKLMAKCNEAMSSFEAEEAEAERRARLAAEQPDEDGFITVTHGNAPSFGATNDLEEGHHQRRRAGKRSRKRKGRSGADELSDFYRFQLKETRKREVVDLKKRFEEDLKKVKKMKEERAYRPF